MGYIRHDAVIASTWSKDDHRAEAVEAFRATLPPEWRPLVIGPIPGVVNHDFMYAFLPDGSKEGWGESDEGDRYRQQFRDLFDAGYPDVVTVSFGGDYGKEVGATVEVMERPGDDDAEGSR